MPRDDDVGSSLTPMIDLVSNLVTFFLARGDRATPWRHVQTLMQACASPGVAIDRIQFAVSAPPADAPGGP